MKVAPTTEVDDGYIVVLQTERARIRKWGQSGEPFVEVRVAKEWRGPRSMFELTNAALELALHDRPIAKGVRPC